MRYPVRRIHSPEEIEGCERFGVDCAQWTCRVRPRTWGYMGYLEGRGLFVKMFCEEREPRRVWKNHGDPVWKDSAMEVFLAFPDAKPDQEAEAGMPAVGRGVCRETADPMPAVGRGVCGETVTSMPAVGRDVCREEAGDSETASQPPADNSLYLNCEMNANGALYAQYGYGKKNRGFVPERFYVECGCRAAVEEERWTAELLVPEWFLSEYCGLTLSEDTPWHGARTGRTGRLFCNFYKISECPEIEHYLSFCEIRSDVPDFHRPSCFAEAVPETGCGQR